MAEITETRLPALCWADRMEWEHAGVDLEVEREGEDSIAVHTFLDGTGSHITYELTRERAIDLARRLLNEARLR